MSNTVFLSKPIIRLIVLLLVFTILFNYLYGIKVYAEAIALTNIGIKVVITILASMGLLAYVQSTWGINSFYQELIEFAETVKGIVNFGAMLIDIGVRAITENVKMAVNTVKSVIREFYLSKVASLPEPYQPTPDLSDAIVRFNYSNYGERRDVFSGLAFREPIGLTGYHLDIVIGRQGTFNGPYILMSIYNPRHLYVDNTQREIELFRMDSTNIVDLKLKIQLVDDGYIVDYYVFDYTQNRERSDSVKFNIIPLSTYIDLGAINPPAPSPEIPVITAPIPKAVPNNLAFPWEKGIDTTGLEGSTVETVLERVNEGSIENYTEEVKELPKAVIDAAEPNTIEVDENGIIVEVDFPDISPVIEENLKQTSLLESILSFLQSLFEVPSEIDIDFSPLRDIPIAEKFPFSLPWDVKRAFNMLKAEPKAPKWEIKIKNASYIIDFAQFEQLAFLSRSFTTIIFVLCLIIVTRRFISGS